MAETCISSHVYFYFKISQNLCAAQRSVEALGGIYKVIRARECKSKSVIQSKGNELAYYPLNRFEFRQWYNFDLGCHYSPRYVTEAEGYDNNLQGKRMVETFYCHGSKPSG